MSLGLIWAWIIANEAALATLLLVISELLGAWPKVKSNGIASFIIIHLQNQLKKRGAKDPTP
jgi:hypothetical protein